MYRYMSDKILNEILREKLKKLNFSKTDIEDEILIIDDTTELLNKFLKNDYDEDLKFAFNDLAQTLTHDFTDEKEYKINIQKLIKVLNDFIDETLEDEED